MALLIYEIIMKFEYTGGCYDFSHSLASEIPPGVIANVASDSGLSGLQNNTNLEFIRETSPYKSDPGFPP